MLSWYFQCISENVSIRWIEDVSQVVSPTDINDSIVPWINQINWYFLLFFDGVFEHTKRAEAETDWIGNLKSMWRLVSPKVKSLKQITPSVPQEALVWSRVFCLFPVCWDTPQTPWQTLACWKLPASGNGDAWYLDHQKTAWFTDVHCDAEITYDLWLSMQSLFDMSIVIFPIFIVSERLCKSWLMVQVPGFFLQISGKSFWIPKEESLKASY